MNGGHFRSPRIAVVIVTYNSSHVLGPLLSALPPALEPLPSSRVVVVDNRSHDETVALVQDTVPTATIVQMGRNAGYAAAFNAGAAAASDCDAVLLLNPDTRPEPQSIRVLVDRLAATGAGIVAPRLLGEGGEAAPSLRRTPTVLRAVGEAVLGGRTAGRYHRLSEVVRDPRAYETEGPAEWVSGAALLMSRGCLEAVGPWDESFFLYSEETDFLLRAREAGFSTVYVPQARMVHLGGDAPQSPELFSLLSVNRVRLYRRRHDRARSATFWAAVTLNSFLRALAGSPVHRSALQALLGRRAVLTAEAAPPVVASARAAAGEHR